jgi:hypothetical protein
MTLSISPKFLEPISPKMQRRNISLWRKKTANIFRGVIEIPCPSMDAASISDEIRLLVKKEFEPDFFVPFAFGTVLHCQTGAPSIAEMAALIDTKSRSEGTWQWLIVTDHDSRRAYGVHTWMQGYLTPVYQQLLKQLEQENYQCSSMAREPDKLFTRFWSVNARLAKMRAVLLVISAALGLVMFISRLFWRW